MKPSDVDRQPTLLRRRSGFRNGVIAVAAVALLAAACSSSTRQGAGLPTNASPTSAGTDAGSASALQQAFVAVVSKVRPEVVEVSTSSGLGSGVVWDNRGDIVTNDHVVGSASTFQVQLVNGQTLSASLVGAYPPDDLAVIRVAAARNLSPARFGNSAELQVGDIVFAVGNPLGLASSVTEGIVSYNGRSVSEGNGIELPSTIQTSALINPGNSGGALVDLAGDVVGIPTLAAIDQEVGGTAAGIGFAIPANTVKLIVSQLIASGHVTNSDRADLGIAGTDAVNILGDPIGVLVVSVSSGGPAAKAGIRSGDVITAINGQPVTSLTDLESVLADLSPGTPAKLSIVRQDGSQESVTVKLGQLTG